MVFSSFLSPILVVDDVAEGWRWRGAMEKKGKKLWMGEKLKMNVKAIWVFFAARFLLFIRSLHLLGYPDDVYLHQKLIHRGSFPWRREGAH